MRTLVVDLVDAAEAIEVAGATTRKVDGPRQWMSFPADLSIHEPAIEDVIRDLYAR